jgi:hypothetical protein
MDHRDYGDETTQADETNPAAELDRQLYEIADGECLYATEEEAEQARESRLDELWEDWARKRGLVI